MLSDLVPQMQLCDWKTDRGMQLREKKCPQCGQSKPITEFAMKGGGRQSYCKECSRAQNRLAYAARRG